MGLGGLGGLGLGGLGMGLDLDVAEHAVGLNTHGNGNMHGHDNGHGGHGHGIGYSLYNITPNTAATTATTDVLSPVCFAPQGHQLALVRLGCEGESPGMYPSDI